MRIFVSYRRKTWPFTQRLAERLRARLRASVFVDIDSIDEDNFDSSILKHLRESDVFVLVVSPQTFDSKRIHRENDWVRREVAEALRLDLPIVLALVEGQAPPPAARLPEDIRAITSKQGIDFYPAYFDAGVDKLAKFIVKVMQGRGRFTLAALPGWAWAAVAVLIAVAGIGFMLLRNTATGVEPTPTTRAAPTFWLENPAGTPPDESPTPPLTAESTPSGMAGSPVTENAQWSPVTRLFDGVQMVLVPTGCFMMGDAEGFDDEQPAHRQCFDAPFWIDRTEVTQLQFGAQGYFPDGTRPIESVNWFEAQAHCEYRGGRLPTEAEWEYAARGPDGLTYPWGDVFEAANVVYDRNSSLQTAAVASKPRGASWVGALDMAGNVSEWVTTIFTLYPYSATDGREDMADDSFNRVIRGGSYSGDASQIRSAYRDELPPLNNSPMIGFRCVRDFAESDMTP